MSKPTRKPDAPFFCSRPWTGFEIEHDGGVKPCCMGRIECGNVSDQSIEDIWNGEGYQEFRRKMAAGQWREVCRPECPRLHGELDDPAPSPRTQEFAENYETNQAEIKRRAVVLESRPRIWKLTHSTLCNLDCIMCYQDRDDLRALPETFYQELAQLYGCIQEIQVLGGEPFAIRRLREFLAGFPHGLHPDAKFSFVTNGTIHDSRTLALVRDLNVAWLSISLDAATEATYARIRRGGNFSNTLHGVQKWISLGRELGFPVWVSFTVMRDNVGEMPLFARLALDLAVDCLFGKIYGEKAEQHLIDEELLRSSIARTKAIIASSETAMPLANLTLAAISSDADKPVQTNEAHDRL